MKIISRGVRFTGRRLLEAVRRLRGKLGPLSLREQDVLLRAATRDWKEGGRMPLVEWVSSRSRDRCESALTCAANWDSSPTYRRATTGEAMLVVARFWVGTYEEAKKIHWTINGWGQPPSGRKTKVNRERKP